MKAMTHLAIPAKIEFSFRKDLETLETKHSSRKEEVFSLEICAVKLRFLLFFKNMLKNFEMDCGNPQTVLFMI